MAVQQGRLSATDTTKDMENFYNDAVVTTVSDVDRIIHNETQFVRMVLQRSQPTLATRGTTSGTLRTSTPHYIDSSFASNPSSDVNLVTIGFSDLVTTSSIVVYSTTAIDDTVGNWTVSSSLSNIESEFNDANFEATISNITQEIVDKNDLAGATVNQFKYTVDVGTPPVDSSNAGLPFWRLTHVTAGKFDNLTEIQVIEPLTPTISYFDTDGGFASSFTFEQPNILDVCYDGPNDRFYTIRFNTDTTGTATVTLSDDFGDGDAGTASGTVNFNTARWTESPSNSQFLRASDELSYNVATGKGQLETTYALAGDFTVQLDVNPQTITDEEMWLVLRTINSSNNTVMSEGVGYDNTPTATGVWFTSYINNIVNSTAACSIREMRPLIHNATDGTDSFTVTFQGGTWTVTGTLTGELSNATTGVLYDVTEEAGTPLEFLISCTATPTNGEQFTFDLVTARANKTPTSTGILSISRTGSNFTTNEVGTGPVSVTSDDVNVEIFGNTNGSVNISADNYTVSPGSGTFPDVSVFTVEKTDAEGDVTGVPLIESFDVIGDPSKTYNDFLDGRVAIACSASGGTGGFIYLKVDNVLYKYANNIALGTEDGTSALVSTTAQIATDGTNSLQWTHESGIGGDPFLTYIEFDETLDIVHLRTIDKDTLQDTTDSKEVLLNISDYSTNEYRVFYDQNDFDTIYYVDSSFNLQSWNIDDRISAFMAVNALDVTLPAGTAQNTTVNAEVINAWGEPLDGKDVTFAVTAGDGAVTPSTDTTVSGGLAVTQFIVGSTVGVSTVTATVTEA